METTAPNPVQDRSDLDTALTDRIAELPARQQELFRLLAAAEASQVGGGRLGPRDRSRPDRLSFAQRRLWFLHQLNPTSGAYNVPFALRMRGELDVAALRRSLDDILERHEVLRTVYVAADAGEAVPVVVKGAQTDLPVTTLTSAGRCPDEVLAHVLTEENGRPFDLSTDIPLRAHLFRLADDEHVLLCSLHHIAVDGWSMRLFATELQEGYARHTQGGTPRRALTLQYADFAQWQRAHMTGPRRDDLAGFWVDYLAGAVAPDLPLDRERPATFCDEGASLYLDLPVDLVSDLRDVGRRFGATLYMTLLSGFAVTLRRWTGREDLIVGTSVSGRDDERIAELIGFFVNTLPVRVTATGDAPFHQLLASTKASSLAALAHQELPFDLIVDAVGGQRDASRPPLTPVMFLLDETDDRAPRLGNLTTSIVDVDFSSSKYELMVSVHDDGRNVRALVEYPTGLFDELTIRRLLGSYLTTLRSIVADPTAPVSALETVTDEERHLQVVEWNATERTFPLAGHTLHSLVERQVALRPDAIAVHDAAGGASFTYATVNARADRLADTLMARGVSPGDVVGLCLPRSVDLVVAVLAVLKTGAAYTPIDPDYPARRRQTLLSLAAPRIVVTSRSAAHDTGFGETPVLYVDDVAGERCDAGTGNSFVAPVVSTDAVAYVIFTSGSTGVPKGIALRHRGVVNNLLDLNNGRAIGEGDAVLALSSPSFDMSVYEMLGMLGAGGTLVVPDQAQAKDPGHWAELIRTHSVTVWNSAPALLEMLLDHLDHTATDAATCRSIRAAFLGGDWIPVDQPDRLRAHAGEVEVVALGGATEASIHSIEWIADHVDPAWVHLPYGRPMANQRAYILGDDDGLLPVGIPGQLHLAGHGLAKGYLDDELTRTAFVDIDVSPSRTERLYRTGDHARFRADGCIELLGRMDHMIKVNGLRIEAGEIEKTICALPEVADAVVTQATGPGGDCLVAHVVAADLPQRRLRDHLQSTLPAYMVPRRILVREALPLTPNGKVDRAALCTVGQDLEAAASASVHSARPASTCGADLQDAVASRWSETLGSDVAVDDDFFRVGGNSFDAVRAVRAVAADHPAGGALRVVDLFNHPTPRAFAHHLDGLMAGQDRETQLLHRMTPPPTTTPTMTLVCVPFGGGDAIAYRPLAEHLPAGVQLLAVSPPGHDPLHPEPMLEVDDLATRVAAEVHKIVDGPFAVYGHCAGVVGALCTTKALEDLGRPPSVLYLAAAFPDDDPDLALELDRTSTDEDIAEHLRSMDGFDGVLPDTHLSAVIAMVRHDMTEAARFFGRTRSGWTRKLTTPVVCIIGDDDIATPDPAGHRDWARYADSVQLAVLPGGRHYFLQHLPERLARMLDGVPPDRTPADHSDTDAHATPSPVHRRRRIRGVFAAVTALLGRARTLTRSPQEKS